MTVADVSLKMNLRLNKGDSKDYDNLWAYHKTDAFNKAVIEWVRRQLRGKNTTSEGDEETQGRVDDLQVLLKGEHLSVRQQRYYDETQKLPVDYLAYKRITPLISKEPCTNIRVASHLREEANVDVLLPGCSFDFEDVFHTLLNNRIRIYHNGDFHVEQVELLYYRRPKVYDFHQLSTSIEFKEDVCELLVDEACKILASDIESFNQKQVAQERSESNN